MRLTCCQRNTLEERLLEAFLTTGKVASATRKAN